MPRTRTNPTKLPIPIWSCPHCGHEHGPAQIVRVDGDNLRCAAYGKDFNAKAAQKPTFDSSVICPICGAAIPAVKMDVRFLARYICPKCGNNVLIEGDKPQA